MVHRAYDKPEKKERRLQKKKKERKAATKKQERQVTESAPMEVADAVSLSTTRTGTQSAGGGRWVHVSN